MNGSLDPIDFRLVNDWQRGFPLVPRPYAELARRLGIGEAETIARLQALSASGFVSRVGAVFRPHTLGWSTLAAVSVPPDELDAVAREINAHAEVNHNYEREHAFNLWFVVTAPTRQRVADVLADIGRVAGGAPLDLPMLEDFHIDLGFDLAGRAAPHLAPVGKLADAERLRAQLGNRDYALAAALEGGIAATPRPYAALAGHLGRDSGSDTGSDSGSDSGSHFGNGETAVIAGIERLLDLGVMRRFGVVVRHRELGYAANAMVVWQVPDDAVSEVGQALARERAVTLCYRRPRRAPDWPYNLFSMLHGQDRQAVLDELARIRQRLGLEQLACAPLFSRRRFKQCGARYASLAKAA